MSKKPWKRYVAVLIIGSLLGGATVVFIHGKRMEDMMLVNQSLQLLSDKLKKENDALKRSQQVSRKKLEFVIEEVRVTVLDPKPHPTIEVQVVDQMEKDMALLKGKKVDQVGEVHDVLHGMLRRREYVLKDGSMVEVRVKTVVISRTLRLFVTAEVKKEDVLKKVARNFLTPIPYFHSESPESDPSNQGAM